MALILNTDLTGVRPFSKNLSDFILGVPTGGLAALYRASAKVTLESGAVSVWGDAKGDDAAQATASKRPVVTAGRIAFDGTDDFLATSELAPPTSGYFVAKLKIKATSNCTIIGSQNSTTARCSLSLANNRAVAGQIGGLSASSFFGATAQAVDDVAVIGLAWDDASGVATLRLNGADDGASGYKSSGQTVGTLPVYLGARNVAGAALNFGPNHLTAVAAYSGVPGDDFDLDEIDAAMAAF